VANATGTKSLRPVDARGGSVSFPFLSRMRAKAHLVPLFFPPLWKEKKCWVGWSRERRTARRAPASPWHSLEQLGSRGSSWHSPAAHDHKMCVWKIDLPPRVLPSSHGDMALTSDVAESERLLLPRCHDNHTRHDTPAAHAHGAPSRQTAGDHHLLLRRVLGSRRVARHRLDRVPVAVHGLAPFGLGLLVRLLDWARKATCTPHFFMKNCTPEAYG